MRPHDGAGPFKDGDLLGHAVVAAVKVHDLPEGQMKSISNQKSNKINVDPRNASSDPLPPPTPRCLNALQTIPKISCSAREFSKENHDLHSR